MLQDGPRHRQDVVPGERTEPGNHLVAHDADRVQIVGDTGRFALDPIRTQIGHCSQHFTGRGLVRLSRFCDAEVGDLHSARGTEQHIPRFAVAVQDSGCVRGAEGGQDVGEHHPDPVRAHGSLGDLVGQGASR